MTSAYINMGWLPEMDDGDEDGYLGNDDEKKDYGDLITITCWQFTDTKE